MNENTENKITLYLDADDTILDSSKAVIEILNERYNITPPKTVDDMMDWGYRSIYKPLTSNDVTEIYSSDEFFDRVKVNKIFMDFYRKNKNKFSFVVVTKGTDANIEKKKKYLKRIFGDDMEYIGIPFQYDYEGNRIISYDKSNINMRHGVQIDDRTDALEGTNANIKILLKNGQDRYWNRDYEHIKNLYVVRDWFEAIEILMFAYNNHYIFKKC